MERTKDNNSESKVIRWKKIGGGSLRLKINGKNTIIKPEQRFRATEEEIPEAFRDVIIPQQEIPGKVPAIQIKAEDPVYTVKPRGKGGWFDVVDADGKALNEKALKEETAKKLVQDLAR